MISPIKKRKTKVNYFFGITKAYGKSFHDGIDLYSELDDPIVAPEEMLIQKVGVSPIGSNYIIAKGNITGTIFRFVHTKSAVGEGSLLAEGDLVGNSDLSGTQFTHLHFETHIGEFGNKVDPIKYFDDNGIDYIAVEKNRI